MGSYVQGVAYFNVLDRCVSRCLPGRTGCMIVRNVCSPYGLIGVPRPGVSNQVLCSKALTRECNVGGLLLTFGLLGGRGCSLVVYNENSSRRCMGGVTAGSHQVRCLKSVPRSRVLRLRQATSLLMGPEAPRNVCAGCSFPSGAVRCLTSKAPALLCRLPKVPGRCCRCYCSLGSRSVATLTRGMSRILSLSVRRQAGLKRGTRRFVLSAGGTAVRYAGVLRLVGEA